MILAAPGALWRTPPPGLRRRSSTRSGDGALEESVKPSRPLNRGNVMLETPLVSQRCWLTSLARSAPPCTPWRRKSMAYLGIGPLGPPLFRQRRVDNGPRLARRRLPDGRSLTAAANCAFRQSAQKNTDLLALPPGLAADGPSRPSRPSCVWIESQGTGRDSSAREDSWL